MTHAAPRYTIKLVLHLQCRSRRCSAVSLKANGQISNCEIRPLEKVTERVMNWAARWENGNPFSALTITTKTGKFVGQIVAGGGSVAGTSEMAYLICESCWNQHYGTEAATAVVKHLAPMLKAYGFKVEEGSFTKIEATARPDNPASGRILRTCGLSKVSEEEKFGALREHYQADVRFPDPNKSWEISVFPDRFVYCE